MILVSLKVYWRKTPPYFSHKVINSHTGELFVVSGFLGVSMFTITITILIQAINNTLKRKNIYN